MTIELRNQGHNIHKIECILKRELSASEIVFAIDQLDFFEETPETIVDMLENFY